MWISRKEYESLITQTEYRGVVVELERAKDHITSIRNEKGDLWHELNNLACALKKILPSELNPSLVPLVGWDFSAIREAASAVDGAERSKRDKELVALVKRIRGEK